MNSYIKSGLFTLALAGTSMNASATYLDFTDGSYASLNGQQSATVGDITFSSYRYFIDGAGNIANHSFITGDQSLVQLSSGNRGIGVNTIPTNIVESVFDDNDKVDGWEFLVLSFNHPSTVNGLYINNLNLLFEAATAFIIDDRHPEFELNVNTDLLHLDTLLDKLTPDAFNFDNQYWDFEGEDYVKHIVLSGVGLSDFRLAGLDYSYGGYPNPVPEPASLLLMASGLGFIGWRRTRRQHGKANQALIA